MKYEIKIALICISLLGFIVFSIWLVPKGFKKIGSYIDTKNSQRGRGDADVANVNNDGRTVYQMPDRFGNVSMFCDSYGNSVYVTTNKTIHTLKDGCE